MKEKFWRGLALFGVTLSLVFAFSGPVHSDVNGLGGGVGNSGLTKPTYRVISGAAPVTVVTGDNWTLCGSATKTIHVTKLYVLMTDNQVSVTDSLVLIRRSTADTSGTSTANTPIQNEPKDINPTATSLTYTVAPTPGTTVGNLDMFTITNSSAVNGQATQAFNRYFGDLGKDIVLRGTAQCIALNGTAGTGFTFAATAEFTEDRL